MSAKYLNDLAIKHHTDKYGDLWYTEYYDTHFKKWRNKKINLVEIGVGGYDDPFSGGNSLRMWKEYFKKGRIYGIDICEKKGIDEERIKVFQGSQTDEKFLKKIKSEINSIDIVIDDGSHRNKDVITSFKILFPLLKIGGIYVVEDIQTSYWPYEGCGGSDDLSSPNTSMNFFKSLTDGLNYQEFINPGYSATYSDMHVVSVHFYHNIIFVYKGLNNKPSNIVRNNSISHLSWTPIRD